MFFKAKFKSKNKPFYFKSEFNSKNNTIKYRV